MSRTLVLAHDPALPGLARALDPELARQAFADLLGKEARALQCTIERIRHKRGQKAIIGYRLDGVGASGAPFVQRAMARVFPPDALADRLHKAQLVPLTAPAIGPAVASLPRLDAIVWLFPNDRKIIALGDLVTNDPLRNAALTWFLHATGQADAPPRAVSAEIVRYVPEQGCTLRWTLDREDGPQIVFAKCRSDARGQRSFRVQQTLAAAGNVPVPTPLAFDGDRNIFWQQGLRGEPLRADDIIARPRVWLPRIAAALFHLRQTVVPALAAEGRTALRDSVRKAMPDIASALPALGDEIQRTALSLEAALATMPGNPRALLHGDLHPSNLMWSEHRLALLDFDTAVVGFAARDFASLTAALIDRAIARGDGDDEIDSIAAAMREHAALLSGGRRAFDTLLAHACFAERLYRSVTRFKTEADKPDRLLAIAARMLAAGEKKAVRCG